MLTKNTKIICTILAVFAVGMSGGSGFTTKRTLKTFLADNLGYGFSFLITSSDSIRQPRPSNLVETPILRGVVKATADTTPGFWIDPVSKKIKFSYKGYTMTVVSHVINEDIKDRLEMKLDKVDGKDILPIFSGRESRLSVSFILQDESGNKFLGLVTKTDKRWGNMLELRKSFCITFYRLDQTDIDNLINGNAQGKFNISVAGGALTSYYLVVAPGKAQSVNLNSLISAEKTMDPDTMSRQKMVTPAAEPAMPQQTAPQAIASEAPMMAAPAPIQSEEPMAPSNDTNNAMNTVKAEAIAAPEAAPVVAG